MPTNDGDSPAARIVYPCIWIYAVIGVTEDQVRQAIASAAGSKPHDVHFSAKSAQGNYCSLHLEIRVENEEDRNLIYRNLKQAPGIKVVL